MRFFRYILLGVFFPAFMLLMQENCYAQTSADLVLTENSGFKQCGAEKQDFIVSVINHTNLAKGFKDGTFQINWGDGTSPTGYFSLSNVPLTHTYDKLGVFNLVISAEKTDGARITRTYSVMNEAQPAISIGMKQSGVQCLGNAVEIRLEGYMENSEQTTYKMDFGDGVTSEYIYGDLVAKDGIVQHVYNQAHCDFEKWKNTGITVEVTAKNTCPEYNTKGATIKNIYVVAPLQVSFAPKYPLFCTESFAQFVNNTHDQNGIDCSPQNTNFKWDFGNGQTSMEREPTNVVYDRPGNYEVTLTASNGFSCTRSTLKKTVRVIEAVHVWVDVNEDTLCEGGVASLTSMKLGDDIRYNWIISPNNGLEVVGGDPNSDAVDVKFNQYGAYNIQLFVENGCSEEQKDTTIIVRKDPSVTLQSLSPICPGTILNLNSFVNYQWNAWDGQIGTPTWEVAGQPGGYSYVEGTQNSLYPKLKFTLPGEYTIKVKLKSVGCHGTNLEATRKITVYDPEIIKNITSTNTTICKGGDIQFTSTSSGTNLQHFWSVQPASGVSYISGNEASASPKIKFNNFGNYKVIATLTGACKIVRDTTDVKVHGDSEVFLELDEKLCPGVVDMSKFVAYQWNNSENRQVIWTIMGDLDGYEYKNGTNENSEEPVIDFKKPGSYDITVALTSIGCPSLSHLVEKQSIKVYDSRVTLNITGFEGDICEGDEKLYTMNVQGEEAKPKWDILPDMEYSVLAGNMNGNFIKVKFNNYNDDYQVIGTVIGPCISSDTVLHVRVKRDPSVVLNEVADMCPGTTLALADYVTYRWYNVPQPERKVEWTIAGHNDGYQFKDGTSATSSTPRIQFNKAGTYTLTATIPGAGCRADSLLSAQTFVVYDTVITLNISPSAQDICEGNTITFNNATTGGIPFTYEWSVDKADGYGFVAGEAGKTQVSPQIKFDNFSEYQVKAKITSVGGCKSKEYTEKITVRGVPVVDFKPLQKICVNTELELKQEHITYTSKGCDLTYKWSVAPVDGVTFNNDAQAYPKLSFSNNKNYQVKVAVTGQCGGTLNRSQEINVIRTEVKAFANSITNGCTDSGLAAFLESTSEGDSLTYKWTITPSTGWVFNGADHAEMPKPTIIINEAANYQVKLEVSNICNSDSKEFKIQAYAKPVITAEDIKDVCENGFIFKGKDRLRINTKNDTISRVEWTINPSHFTFVNSTSAASVYPEMTFEDGAYQMVGKYWNRCADPGVVNITVTVDRFPHIVPLTDTTVCSKISPFVLKAMPAGGTWTTPTAGLIMQDMTGAYYFDPYIDADADYMLTYTVINKSCTATDAKNVHTHKLPVVNAGVDQDICINNNPRALIPVEPVSGGWWEGTGVNASGVFTPDAVGARPLKYYYTSPVTGCTNKDELIMSVWELPVPTFTADLQYCLYAEALFHPTQLNVGNQFNWDFGDGNKGTSVGTGAHIYTDFGYRDVVLEAVSVHGCRDTSDAVRVEIVNLPPAAEFTIDKAQGCGPHEINATINPDAYTDHNLHFKWNFADQITTETLMPPNPVVLEAGVWDTTYNIRFTVYNICETKFKDIPVLVFSSPMATFTPMHDWECSPVDALMKNTSTGNNCTYIWDFGDGTTAVGFEPPKHLFTTDSVTKIYDIILVAKNKCGVDSMIYPLEVRPKTITAFFKTPKTEICVGEKICFTNHSSDSARYIVNKTWNFGDGAVDTAWHSCHSYPKDGNYKVHLFIDNGCGFDTISDQLTVHSLPVLTINSEDNLCENDTFHFNLIADRELRWHQWAFGDGSLSAFASNDYVYDGYGKYRVSVEGISKDRGACKSVIYKDIEVWPNPRVTILPLDTAVCAPFLYKPDIIGEGFLMWDYGDGSEQTSAKEHLYENTTDEVLKHLIRVYASSDKGCKSDYSGELTLYNVPRAGIDSKMTLGKPQVVEFINLSESYDECIWYLPFGKIVRSFENQKVAFYENDLHTISLVARNKYGCQDSVAYDYQTTIKGMYFPNTFMPHSSDPKVNRFNAVAMGLREYKLEIYDQYGNKVWETSELDGDVPAEGWEGRNNKGEMLPQGVYIWRAKARFLDDREWTGDNDSGVGQTTQGTVMLLRP